MHYRSVPAIQTDALFASALQRSDEHTVGQLRLAIAAALDEHGDAGCAGRVAQEFGDHPETAVARMRWACAMVAELDGQPVPGMRRMATVGTPALVQRPTAGFSALRPAYLLV
jgi:hypothetical protein